MKNFKIQVDNHKVDFFKQLLDHLDFVSYEEVEGFSEPRIYPAADFEIRSEKDRVSIDKETMNRNVSVSPPIEHKDTIRKDALSDIRNVMANIEKMRNKSK